MTSLISYIQRVFSFDPHSPLLFTQLQFWVFFALVFCGFSLLVSFSSKRQQDIRRMVMPLCTLKNAYLFLVSLLFYYKTSGLFVGLLILVTCTDYTIARLIYRFRDDRKWKRKALLVLSVFVDLSILCYFKYSYFFADVVNHLFGTNFEVTNIAAKAGNLLTKSQFWSVDRIILPVGISFYTFQVISYTTDVYRGLVKPVRNILDFGFYVTFFPQLVAGPIIKASDFIPQLYRPYHLSRMQFGMAVFWILNGLLKKIVLSDFLAVNFIDRVFANPTFFTGFENLMALFVYSLQVYADFSGYTDIAIGLSQLMGFYLPKNFDSPYKAPNCSNFWKRWHISLSRWLQNYLYIPLGGNRNVTFGTFFWIFVISVAALILSGNLWIASAVAFLALLVVWTALRYPEKRRHIYANLNSMITMLLGGLWHGASCNFMVWGGLNGVGMVVYKFWRDMSLLRRALWSTLVTVVLSVLAWRFPLPLWNLLLAFSAFIFVSAWIRLGWTSFTTRELPWVERAWSIGVTFTFITFTRLFFRSGSNLNPAVANETAWRIATSMVNSIGSAWQGSIWKQCVSHRGVFLLFLLGMIIHWLPTRTKRRYRICFAKLPLPVIYLAVLGTVFVAYQFITSEMQPFIYFQF